jgi:hypothetical protein
MSPKEPAKKNAAKATKPVKKASAKKVAAPKGKATPTRKAAEAKLNVNAISAPATKASRSRDKSAVREARMASRAAYMRGEESALPARDKGPVRRFVRDYVDSRRTVGEYFLPAIVVVLFLTVIPNRAVQLFAILFMYAAMLYSIVTGFFFTRAIKKEVAVRFPGQSVKGIGMYGWLRSTQMRRMRAPAPQVSRGDKI